MDLIKFNQRVKHGRLDFHPGPVYGFEDEDAAPYFKACGWADDVADDQTPDVTVTIGELDIDPLTIWGDGPDRGKFVMPERAAAAIGTDDLERVKAFVAGGIEIEAFRAQIQAELKGA